jgi:cytochrome c biogenesis protein CcmG, thiol:disulfide interchange protein DsbE
MSRRGVAIGATAVVLGSILILSLAWGLQHAALANPPVLGRAAPQLAIQTVSGDEVNVWKLQGRPVVLNFWASWCEPCKGEAKMLEQAWQRYKSKGVVFVGVDYHDVTGDARRFLERHDITYPTVQDGSGMTADRYGVSAVPETYFIDRRGRLVGEHIKGTVANQQNAFFRGVTAALGS